MTRPGHPADTPDPFDASRAAVRTVDNPGPFETERQARELPAVRAVYAAFDADPGVGKMTPHILRMLLDALAAAGVRVGAYDVQIAEWLAGWEPQTVAVIAGWVQRARQAGDRADALLARTREGPPGERAGGPTAKSDRHQHASSPPPPQRQGPAGIVGRRGHGGQAPREVTP